MIQARIHKGRVEVQEPIPEDWEGQLVKLLPLSPHDPVADLEERSAALHALGPMEFEADEREQLRAMLTELDRRSRDAMRNIAGSAP